MDITRESILVAAVRIFCTAFAAVLGILIACLILFMGFSLFSGSTYIPEKNEMTISVDAEGQRELLSFTTPVILRIDIHGVVGDKNLTAEKVQNILLDSREDLFKNNRVKGVLLHMDTPGGTVTDADGIYRALMAYKEKYKVPVYAYVDGLCASGGVYITAAAERIYASPPSVVGSIGVILGPTFNFMGTMEKVGMKALTITEGKDKDALNPFRQWQPDEDKTLRAITSALYDDFVNIVTTARPHLNKEALINVYGAHVFIGAKAQELGYIDVCNSNYSAALTALAQAAGIEQGQAYQVVQLKPPQNFFSQLTEANSSLLSGKITHVLQLNSHLTSEMSGKFLYLYQAP